MGYDLSMFLNPIHRELMCTICYGIFQNPIYLPLCRHVFCSDCISTWLNQAEREMKCPIDKTPIKLSKEKLMRNQVPYALTNIISESIVYCKYKENGCSQTFSLSAFNDHIKKCDFKPSEAGQGNNSTAAEQVSNSVASTTDQSKDKTSPANKKIKKWKSQNLCKLAHPKKNENVYFCSSFKLPENKKIVRLDFKNISASYKLYTLASYIKHLNDVQVCCIHTDSKYAKNLSKDLQVFISEDDCEKVMRSELWPTKVTIQMKSGFKQTIVKGSLKTSRSENFYGFNTHDDVHAKAKELKRQKKKERREAAKKLKEGQSTSNQVANGEDASSTLDKSTTSNQPTSDQQPAKPN